MCKKVPEDSPLREGLDIIIRETVRCRTIIQELLEFSRNKEPHKLLSNINRVIEKALRVLENELMLHHISVESDLAANMKQTLLDENLMEQVFVNMLLNAIQAIGDHGKVVIRSNLNPSGDTIIVELADTGCGIDTENIDKIFEPFFSTKSKGTGLGLAVSYGIVGNHHGDIRVSRTGPQGTSFTLEIPVIRKEE